MFRDAGEGPRFERVRERVLNHVLGQREVVDPEELREQGQEPRRFVPEEVFARPHHYSFRTGLTSMQPPSSKPGQVSVSLIAWSRSLA